MCFGDRLQFVGISIQILSLIISMIYLSYKLRSIEKKDFNFGFLPIYFGIGFAAGCVLELIGVILD